MGDYWFASVPIEKQIRMYGGRFKGITNTAHALFYKAEL